MHEWNICSDLKVTALILSLQLGYTSTIVFCVTGIVGTEREREREREGEREKRESFFPKHKNVKHDFFFLFFHSQFWVINSRSATT